MHAPEILSRYREAIDNGLRAALAEGNLPLFGMLRYHMGWVDAEFRPMAGKVGKGVRPALCLYASEAVGADWRAALPAAISFELVHNFSLIHDDIQDGDTERHSRPTVWYQWGHSHGLNAGSALHILANLGLDAVSQENAALSAAASLRTSQILAKASLEMIEGQTLDMAYETHPRVTTADYLVMIEKKTGALLEGSLHAGAAAGTDDPEVLAGMRRFGHAIGRLFQVKDDMLGIWGQSEETGKPIAGDLHRRKKSLPVVYTLEQAGTNPSSKRFADIYRTKEALSEGDVAILLEAMDGVGAGAFCRRLAVEEADKAREALASVDVSPWAKAQGGDLVTFLLERDH